MIWRVCGHIGTPIDSEQGNHFALNNGNLSLEAEGSMHLHSGEGPSWQFANDSQGYSGTGYMTTNADGYNSGNQTSGSQVSWDVEFDSAGSTGFGFESNRMAMMQIQSTWASMDKFILWVEMGCLPMRVVGIG